MDPGLLFFALAVAAVSAAVTLVLHRPSAPDGTRRGVARGRATPAVPPDQAVPELDPDAEVAEETFHLIRSLPGPVVLVDDVDTVLYVSPPAARMELVRGSVLAFGELGSIARQSIGSGTVLIRERALRRPPLRKGRIDVRIRAIPMRGRTALLLIDDLTEERRVDDVRRDFIANVSHELKTPVGAISLLAEALMSASDDPQAVQHFANRLHMEAGRLSSLINDVIDLSRLQGGDPLVGAQPVSVDVLVDEALDFVRAAADARNIEVVSGGTHGLTVLGMPDQLVAAIRNLLTNAIAYSPDHTRVAVAVRRGVRTAEIAVKDQGIGINDADQSRIFERFYRVDSARSRATGGTGLGLAIVRNVCHNHGGEVTVWSVPGEGSTFTMRLPLQDDDAPGPAAAPAAERSNARIKEGMKP